VLIRFATLEASIVCTGRLRRREARVCTHSAESRVVVECNRSDGGYTFLPSYCE
jgi:hypothetical protein